MTKKTRNKIFIILAIVIVVAILIVIIKKRMGDAATYFDYSEFDSPDQPGSGKKMMSKIFIKKLNGVREAIKRAIIVTSGYRSPAFNSTLPGAVPNSAHTKGVAADLAAETDEEKLQIAIAAIRLGIKRIGWGSRFIHLDMDESKPQNVVWGYSGNKPPYSYSQLKAMANVNS